MLSQYKRLWIALAAVVVASFSVLGYYGYRAITGAPPIPREVKLPAARVPAHAGD